MSAGETPSLAALRKVSIEGLLAPVADQMRDERVDEIMINGPNEIFIERQGVITLLEGRRFGSAYELEAAARAIAQFVGKRLSPEELSIEARLPDGSRVHILQPPAAQNGLCIAIRRFRTNNDKAKLDFLVEQRAMTRMAVDFLAQCVLFRKNIIISGGTGTGKTTLVGALASVFPDDDRIIVIEDVKELDIRKPHVLSFEAQKPDRFGHGGISIRELFRASLRMRPDRIIVGECRGGEAVDMIQAMTSGHTGSLSTLHANTPYGAMNRLETMAMMGDLNIPLGPMRTYISSAVDIVIQIVRKPVHVRVIRDGREVVETQVRRFVSEIAELETAEGLDHYVLRPIFTIPPGSTDEIGHPKLVWTGSRPSFAAEALSETARLDPGAAAEIWQV